jgi:hypothetical protein
MWYRRPRRTIVRSYERLDRCVLKKGREMLEALIALAALAGNTVVTAATTDVWEAARRGFARLLGRGDTKKEQLAGKRLDETRQQLADATAGQLEKARAELCQVWQVRIRDLLEEDPGVEAELRALVEELQAQMPEEKVMSAADHAVAAGRDVTITADGGGIAAAVIHGNVMPGPTRPGPVAS